MPTALCSIFFFLFLQIFHPSGMSKINPDRDEIFIDILLKTVNKIPLGMIYNDLIYSKIKTTEQIFNGKHSC